MLLFGLPPNKLTVKDLKATLERRFSLLKKLSEIKNSLDLRSADSTFSIPNFLAGKTFSYLGSIGMVQQNIEDYGEFKIKTLNIPAECKLTSGITFAGVLADSSLQPEAFAVCDFLTSREAQNIIADYGINCACYESSNRLLPGIDPLEISKITPRLSMNNTLVSEWYWVFCYALYPIIQQEIFLQNSKISKSVENAVNIIQRDHPGLLQQY